MDRYFTWRHAIKRPVWAVDRHWYVMLAMLFALPTPQYRNVRVMRVYRKERGDARDKAIEPFDVAMAIERLAAVLDLYRHDFGPSDPRAVARDAISELGAVFVDDALYEAVDGADGQWVGASCPVCEPDICTGRPRVCPQCTARLALADHVIEQRARSR